MMLVKGVSKMPSTLKELKDELDELQGNVDDAVAILEDAYTPAATRADLVSAVSEALDLLAAEEEEEEEDGPNGDQDED